MRAGRVAGRGPLKIGRQASRQSKARGSSRAAAADDANAVRGGAASCQAIDLMAADRRLLLRAAVFL
jgi:hypothetical protein